MELRTLLLRLNALHQTIQTFGIKSSHQKTKIMAFVGTEPMRSKIVIDNILLEQMTLSHTWAVTFHSRRERHRPTFQHHKTSTNTGTFK
jgi:predicted chitinase